MDAHQNGRLRRPPHQVRVSSKRKAESANRKSEVGLSPVPSPMPPLSLRSLLANPLTRGLDLDDPHTTALRRQIVRDKIFLRRIYEEWYSLLAADVPPPEHVPGDVLELGSGAGFLSEYIPGLITSDVLPGSGHMVVDARDMPFPDEALRAIVMSDVLHHIPEPRRFFAEAARCTRPAGTIAMIEPWVTPWSRLIYRRLHHEPFRPEAASWEFPESGPLSGANGALPWIIFARDRHIFERDFPQWRIQRIQPFMPLRYLLSGGISMRALAPSWSFAPLRTLERAFSPIAPVTAMFAHITLVRNSPRPAKDPLSPRASPPLH
jgi:SAM-dependent methyltransferase